MHLAVLNLAGQSLNLSNLEKGACPGAFKQRGESRFVQRASHLPGLSQPRGARSHGVTQGRSRGKPSEAALRCRTTHLGKNVERQGTGLENPPGHGVPCFVTVLGVPCCRLWALGQSWSTVPCGALCSPAGVSRMQLCQQSRIHGVHRQP